MSNRDLKDEASAPPVRSEEGNGRIARAGEWKRYAAAAGATLAMASGASADIIYSGPLDVSVSVPVGGPQLSAVATFMIAGRDVRLGVMNEMFPSIGYGLGEALLNQQGPNPILFAELQTASNFVAGYHPALRFASGQAIPPTGARAPNVFLRGQLSNTASALLVTTGRFGPGTATGFVGFQLPDGDLGWLRVEVSDRGSLGFPNQAAVIDYAYNSVAGAPISAGEMPVVAAVTPEPGTAALGLLALGASGLMAWRRRRAEVSQE